jgi:phospholipid/cholesterol/gamma-HCH transport system ATP-binding protein
MAKESRIVLDLDDITLLTDSYGGIGPVEIAFKILSTEFFLLQVEHWKQGMALADMCSGLLVPSRGEIRFLGKNWHHLSADTANALRGRIGRVFLKGLWINHFSVLDNVLLQQMHHTQRDAAELRNEAARLARRIGLPGIALGFPENHTVEELQVAACVRACMGHPALILLEEPTLGLPKESLPKLMNVLRSRRDQGAAIVWITSDNSIWREASIPSTRRLRWVGRKLFEVRTKHDF